MEIRDFWKATLRQDAAAMRRFFAPGARVRWHNTNEAFSAEEFVEVNCEYPGAWDGEVERVERLDGLIVTAVRVFAVDQALSFHVVSFFRVRDGKIVSLDEYWGDDGAPPQWRLDKKIGKNLT